MLILMPYFFKITVVNKICKCFHFIPALEDQFRPNSAIICHYPIRWLTTSFGTIWVDRMQRVEDWTQFQWLPFIGNKVGHG